MPNQSVPAAAEGLPTVFIKENRIVELSRQISELLDDLPGRDFVTIFAASNSLQHRVIIGATEGEEFKPEVGISHALPAARSLSRSQKSHVIDARDALSEAIDLCMLTGMGVDFIQRFAELNAVGAGVIEVQKRLERIGELLDSALEAKQ